MKKVALSLLALALVGAGAFAQDAPAVKIGGYLDMGTLTTIKADSGNQTIVKGDDSGKVGGSYEFRLAYGTAKSGLVLNIRLENLASGTVYNAQDAFSWFLLPGVDMVKVKAGQFGNTGLAWNQLDDKGDKQGNGLGVALEVTPTDGFTAGGSYLPPVTASGTTSDLGKFGAGATYTVPSTAQVVFGLLTGNNTSPATAVDNVAASFKLLLDGPLSAKGGLNLYNMAYDKKTYSTTMFDVTVGYAVTDAFSASLLTYVWLPGSDFKTASGDSAAVSYKVNPSVSYTVDPVTAVGIGGTYFQGDTAINGAAPATGAFVKNKLTQIEVNPNATFTIDANQKVYVNYLYDTVSGDDKPPKDQSWSTIKIDYRYIF